MSHVQYKYTPYFLRNRQKSDRKQIKLSWIRDAIENPDRVKIQENTRISVWKFIKTEQMMLRVILLQDGRTIHNCYFDRDERRRYMKARAKQKRQYVSKKVYAY